MVVIKDIVDSSMALKINSILGIILLAIFCIYFFSKEGKDERGRKNIATAALVSFFMLFILLNILPVFLPWLMESYVRLMNGLQFLYSIILLTADIALIILRKIR